jgi:hypothetical protein
MGAIIDVEPPTKKLTFPLIMALSNAIMVITLRIATNIQLGNKDDSSEMLFSHPFLFTWLMFVSESFIIIIYFLKRRPHIVNNRGTVSKVLDKDEDNSLFPSEAISSSSMVNIKQTKDYIMKNPEGSKIVEVGNLTKDILIKIGSFALMDYISTAGNLINRETNIYFLDFAVKALLIIFTSLFSLKLKFQFHRHHIFGIGIVLFGISMFTFNEILDIFIKTPDSEQSKNYKKWLPFFICLAITVQLATAGQECSEKYMMQYKYIDPFLMKGLEGIIGTIISSLLFIPYQFITCPKFELNFCYRKGDYPIEDFIKAWKFMVQYWEVILCLICYIFSCFLFQLYRILTNHFFSPNHRALADALSGLMVAIGYFIFQIFNLFQHKLRPVLFYIISVVSYCFIFFGVLVVLEIIIIKLWNLDMNTFKNIVRRGANDISEEEVESVTREANCTKENLNDSGYE